MPNYGDATRHCVRTPNAPIEGAAGRTMKHVVLSDASNECESSVDVSIHKPFRNVETLGPATWPSTGSRRTTGLAVGVLIDLPLLVSFALYLFIIGIDRIGNDYLVPHVKLQYFAPKAATSLTYYHRVCDASDQSTHDTLDLTLPTSNTSTEQAVHVMQTHGVAMLPHLLSEDTASALRDFILTENQRGAPADIIPVIENEQRWSFAMRVDQHPSVTRALEELLRNERLVHVLEAVVGPNPAVIELTAITQAYGAKDQRWHQDVTVDGNAAKHARNFVPSYGLFIPLQNVTAAMGATGVCPGTHMCSEGTHEFCAQTGFQLSGSTNHWPLGSGALLNQQLTHRGAAHVDAHAPHRVLFIISFAPRPQTQRQSMETRLIGLGGSYSLHWSHWGHTLADYQRPLVHMRHPWRELRSLGLYKPRTSQWGWDYVTVSAGRIANDEFEEYSPLWWLPRALQGDHGYDFSWVHFLQETVTKCREASTSVYRTILVTVMFALVLVGRNARSVPTLLRHMTRLVVGHAVLLFAAWVILTRVFDSDWGRNIASERNFVAAKSSALADLPATLPTKLDILMADGMKSEHFSSYIRMIETNHPGNVLWSNLIAAFATGYDTLPLPLQKQIQTDLLTVTKKRGQRLLIQTPSSNWAVAPNQQWLCHKHLRQGSSRYINRAMEILDFQMAEIRFGIWRDSSMQQRYVAKLVASLRDKILGMPLSDVPLSSTDTMSSLLVKPAGKVKLPAMSDASATKRVRSSLPRERDVPRRSNVEPWVQENDIVEANVHGNDEEWYRAHVVSASSNSLTWDVIFDDGEEGDGLCQSCVRTFVPYAINDEVEVLEANDRYSVGRIVANDKANGMSVRVDDGSDRVLRVETKDIRRREIIEDKHDFDVGTEVLAMSPGLEEDGWFPGVITRQNSERTYFSILFDDGDFAPLVPVTLVKKR